MIAISYRKNKGFLFFFLMFLSRSNVKHTLLGQNQLIAWLHFELTQYEYS